VTKSATGSADDSAPDCSSDYLVGFAAPTGCAAASIWLLGAVGPPSFGRWAASLRAITPTIAGMSGVEPRQFAIANAVGATTWATTAAMLGYLVGASYRSVLSRLSLSGTLVVGLLVLLALARWWHLRRGTRRASGTKVA
jgi:hypothetical protein